MTIPESHIRAAADSVRTSSIGKQELENIAKIMLEALPYADLLAFWAAWKKPVDNQQAFLDVVDTLEQKLKSLEGK